MYLFDNFGARIIVLVDTVSKSEEDFLFVLDFVDEFGNVVLGANGFEHADDCFIGASVLGAIECASCGGNGGVDIDS